MKNPTTGIGTQRADFIESLYASLHKKTSKAIENQGKLIAMAASYLNDGLESNECAELLMIEGGLSRKSAEDYISMAKTNPTQSTKDEYVFQFEDDSGNRMSSYEIRKVITASSEKEARDKAEEILNELNIEATITLVSKV